MRARKLAKLAWFDCQSREFFLAGFLMRRAGTAAGKAINPAITSAEVNRGGSGRIIPRIIQMSEFDYFAGSSFKKLSSTKGDRIKSAPFDSAAARFGELFIPRRNKKPRMLIRKKFAMKGGNCIPSANVV